MTVATPPRERTAERLLRSSAKASFDPLTDIDWQAPLQPGRWFTPARRVSLYGTALWERMSEQQRIDLSRHEVASIASVGIWFEEILMQMLLRYAYDRDLRSAHVQWALTEIADECRHSVMFAKMIDKLGTPNFGVDRTGHELGRFFKATSDGPQTFAGTIYVEEVLDALQREAMADDTVQPLVRAVSRLHVVEEARHISYAREELARVWERRGRAARAHDRFAVGLVVYFATTRLVHPDAYAAVGLDRREAVAAAAGNPHWRATKTFAAAKVLATFAELGLVGRENRWLLARAGVLG